MPLSPEQQEEIEAQRTEVHETRRVVSPRLEEILYKVLPVLDHGFVRVIDYMGDDAAIVQAARVSYGKGTRTLRSDAGLIDYLMRHRHTTPFEMCEIKYHVKLPIFVARQWIRHRTANVNEYSARYSVLDREFYVPDTERLQRVKEEQTLRRRESHSQMNDLFGPKAVPDEPSALAAQSSSNKQGREGALAEEEAKSALSRINAHSMTAYGVYRNLRQEDKLARELARAVLPVNYYTQFYWKIDLHNLMHFLSLRADDHAQYEIRAYAHVMLDTLQRWVPRTYEAFVKYDRGGVRLSSQGLEVVKRMIGGEVVTREDSGLSGREWRELMETLDREA
jgi:thymidylate synthase (FAD)